MGRRSYDNAIEAWGGKARWARCRASWGRRLFDQLPERIELAQTGLSKTDGVTHLDYRVVR